MKNFTKIVLVFAALIFVAGCGQDKTEGKETKTPVAVTTVQLGDITQSLEYTGDIEAEFQVNVFSKIPDRIETFFVDDGDYVKKGDRIARIAATTIEQGVKQAEAGLSAAKAQLVNLQLEYDRANRLYKENAMSKQQFDGVETQFEAVKAQVKQAEAGLKSAKSTFGDATITAPISGIIGKRYMENGDMASPAMPVVTIVQMENVKIKFNAPETDLGRLKIGQKAYVAVKSYSDKKFEGEVVKISPILDPVTRMADVEILINNSDQLLKPGMFGNIEIITGVLKNKVAVPRYSTIENTTVNRVKGVNQVVKNYYVFVVKDDSIAVQRKLDVNYVNHINIAVDGGVEIGEKIVIEGHNNLRDEMPVLIVKEETE